MTAPQTPIPDDIADTITRWADRIRAIEAIDADLAQMDVRIAEYTKALGNLRDSHAAKGRQRTELVRSAERLRHMAEQGCAFEGIPAPDAAAITAPLTGPGEPSPAQAIDNALEAGPHHVIEGPSVTQADPTAGGDQPGQGGFQPEPRRRGGGRRG